MRFAAAVMALVVALVAGGSVWCQPLCSPADVAAPSCHAAAAEAPSVAEPHDCGSHSLAAFTVENSIRPAGAQMQMALVSAAIDLVAGARVASSFTADRSETADFAPPRSIRVLRI